MSKETEKKKILEFPDVYITDGYDGIRYYVCPIKLRDNVFGETADYSQLSGWFRTAAIIGKFITERKDRIDSIVIGGGSDDIYDTGTAAYDAKYSTLNNFVQNCRLDYEKAELAAGQKYGSWFSGLDYHFIKIRTPHYIVRIGSGINVDIPVSSAKDSMPFLNQFAKKFGDYEVPSETEESPQK